ncbi:MAG: TonB-dependent receptor [Gammaproteobacteria bacterium]|nr:TonB-dependent receptor [Gammaproteobacteria bacterium]
MDSTLADDVRWAVYFQQSSTDQRSIEERAASSRSPSPTRRFPEFRFDEKVTGASVSAARDVRKGRTMHRLLYGLQLDRRAVNESRDNLLVNLDTGAATKIVLGETFPVRDFPVTQITEAAVFLHDEITPGEGRFTLIPGLRAEYYRLDPQPDSVYTEDNPSSGVVSISEVSLAPKLGAVIQLNESTSLFAQYARGFRSPPFEDANIGLEVPLFNVRAIANPDLKPETSDGVEIGLRVVSGRWRGSLSAYQNRYKNFIDSKVNLGPDPQTGVLIFQSLNRDRATIRGIEGEFEFDLGSRVQGLAIMGSLADTRGEDSIRKLPLNTVDPLRATLGMRYDEPGQRWGTELVARFAAAKTRVDDSSAALFRPPGYGLVDLLAYYRPGESSRINFALLNLGNKRYWDWADVRGRPAGDPLIDFYTRPGFNIAASFALSW